jgi:hypothetical protein
MKRVLKDYHQGVSIRQERVEASNSCARILIFGSVGILQTGYSCVQASRQGTGRASTRCHASRGSGPRPALVVGSSVVACRTALDPASPHGGGSGADMRLMALRGLWAMRIKNNLGYASRLVRYRGMHVCYQGT